MKMFKRILLYLAGLFCIAVGINVAKLAGLGISPVSSVPRALVVVWGFSLGTMIMLVYCALVLLQLIVLRKDFRWVNTLGVPVGIVFGSLVDFVGINPATAGHLMARLSLTQPATYFGSLAYLILSICIIGFGVTLYLMPKLIPMPGEGLAEAISKKTGKAFGDCKTIVDVSLILIALILQLLFLGGFSSFTGDKVVVREGTVLSAVLVGQTVKFFRTKVFTKPIV